MRCSKADAGTRPGAGAARIFHASRAAATRWPAYSGPGIPASSTRSSHARSLSARRGASASHGNVTVYDGKDHGGRPFLLLQAGARCDLRRGVAL